ncbi:MAG: response regulator [Bacteriovoracaceae bacterium]|nr:response regulator [Bacteriovoracaceae bacterium]
MGNPIRILSLDDDQDFTTLLGSRLKKPQFILSITNDSMSFLDTLKNEQFELILLDRNLGPNEPSGANLISIIRETMKIKTPIIMLSHHDDYQGIQDCLEIGADDYVTKPLDELLLKSKIQYLIDDKHLDLDVLHIGRVPSQAGQASLKAQTKIIEINELGIKIAAPFFIRKGALVRSQAPLLQEICAHDSIVMNVASSELKSNGQYVMSLEFDPEDKDILIAIKSWLS